MSTQPITQQVRWQDLTIQSEVDIVLELSRKDGWEDCEIFGYGDMITQPQESKGWKLIPADLYKYSIPTEAVARLHKVLNAGIRIKGVIIADDERGTKSPPETAKSKISLPSIKTIVSPIKTIASSLKSFASKAISSTLSFVGKSISSVGEVISLIGKVLLRLILITSAIVLFALFILAIKYIAPIIFLGLIVLTVSAGPSRKYVEYDPKLVILVEDGKGGTVWVSLFTWYD